MKEHLKHAPLDIVLCSIAAFALAYILASGFDATYAVQDNLALFIVPIVCLTAVLYLISYSLRTAVVGGIILAVAAVIGLVVLAGSVSESSPFDDVVGYWGLFWAIVVLSTLGVFLLSRRKTTTLILMVAGVALCCVIEFLYWDFHIVAFLLFLLSSVALIALKGYQAGLSKAYTARPAFGAVTIASICLAGIALLAAAGVFYAFIAPMDPPRLELILNTRYESLEEVEVKGIGSTLHIEDPNLLSSTSNGLMIASNNAQQSEEESDENMDSTQPDDLAEAIQEAGGSLNIDIVGENEAGQQINMSLLWQVLAIVLIVVVVAIFAAIIVKKILRRRWFGKVARKDPKDQVRSFYAFIVSHLASFGIVKGSSLTFAEFAENAEPATVIFSSNESNATIKTVTDVYTRTVYGDMPVGTQEVASLRNYSKAFYRNARKYAGPFRYVRKFFFI